LDVVVDLLRRELPLPVARRDHALQGEWNCHIQPDWLLIYQTTDDEVRLARTGTHADLFGDRCQELVLHKCLTPSALPDAQFAA
jgi:mRNA interferase YafQ